MTAIRPLRGRDLRRVLAIERRAFPQDPWTATMGKGWLARATRDGNAWYAGALARLLRFSRVGEAITLARLVRLVSRGRPAGLSYIVAEADGEIAGYGCLHVAGRKADLQMLAVRPGREGQGVGTRLVAELVAMARAQECHEIFLYVRADNSRARQLYQRAGFTGTGTLARFYQPSGTDAVVMSLSLARLSPAGVQREPSRK